MTYERYQSIIAACYACADECDRCASTCLQAQDVKAHCVSLSIDCAAMCRMAAGFMARRSEFANEIAWLCAGICEASANECEQHKDSHCQSCAVTCRRCSEACRTLASSSTS